MNKKLLLSTLLALPMIAMQIQAVQVVSDVSLGNSDTHAQDTLSTAINDAQITQDKTGTMIDLNSELLKLELDAKDAMERTAELHQNNPARKAALNVQNSVKQATDAVSTMHKSVAQAVQAARATVNAAVERSKKNNQMAFEAYNTFLNAIQQVRNPREGLGAK